MHFLVLRGIREAASINQVTTVAKLVPLALFVLLVGLAFRTDVFTQDLWGRANPALGSVTDQVRSMMLVTVWVFIGVEGASVCSARAERRVDVGRATLLGFLFTLALMVSAASICTSSPLTMSRTRAPDTRRAPSPPSVNRPITS